jgi:hypothetical protein
MAESTLEERLARYGTALDEARRQGVVRRVSVVRRLVPAVSFVAAFALVIGAVVLIARDDEPAPTRPADVAAAEAEIRQAFSTWLDRAATAEERASVRETLADPGAQARAEAQWKGLDDLFQTMTARIDKISFVDAEHADVDFRFVGAENASIINPGGAVLQGGRWRVTYSSVCVAGGTFGTGCAPEDFLTDEQQAIGQPFVNIAWSELSDDQRVRDIERGEEIRDQILDAVNRHRAMLGAKTKLLAVRHRPGEKTAKVWWTVGTVQPGVAVLDGDHWTVSRETWCKLSQNAGEYPPVCGVDPPPPPTTTTLAPLPTTLDIQLGTRRLWPADDRPSDSSVDLTEAAQRFFAALLLPDAVITAPANASGPTWVRAEVGAISVPVLLVPADGIWTVHSVSFGVIGGDYLYPDADVTDWEVTWIDEGGLHRSRTRGRDFSLPSNRISSAIGIARNATGQVLRVSGGVYGEQRSPRPTTAPPCGAADLTIAGGNSISNHVGGGDAIFLALENKSALACRAADVPQIELHGPSGWTRFTVHEAPPPDWSDSGVELESDGLFTPDLVGEVFIGGRQGDGAVEYDSVRLTLPSGEHLELALHLRTAGTALDVSRFLLHWPHA